jgi:ribose transport system ATP-binding protein
MIFGACPRDGGEIVFEGESVNFRHPSEAMGRGIAYVPEDRLEEAAFLDLDVRENYMAASLRRFFNGLFIRKHRERSAAIEAIETLRVKTNGPGAIMSTLSGGNQQKVIVGRWLAQRPRLLLLDEPTQGVDVGARSDTYEFIRQVVEEGTSVVLVSSDFEELARLSDRVIGLSGGCIAGEHAGPGLDAATCSALAYSNVAVAS